ncbi:uncharacterized protein TEOVI_000178300 [Trypanosoma equiperdum]|uniref:AAA+ ATPase domain-containing protein n=2 Tax=Trypanozoon TaxID=39700 RepID=Q382P2_TRYB2|nr:hypothetical protein, conserved [Trypanosoma brucei brucei TREU927]EAN80239.1 hypothetical protein, conserved [Trypanosoma brucei brucei TREU927]SCU70210.1 hypothetical protein, conserved [Trypanosoma equiperdum]
MPHSGYPFGSSSVVGVEGDDRHSSVSLFVILFLCVLLTAVEPSVAGADVRSTVDEVVADTSEPTCPPAPVCSRYKWLSSSQLYCWMSKLPSRLVSRELPFATDDKARRLAISNVEELLRTRLVGQGHLTEAIASLMRKKLSYPHEPLVLHFAGDNGVGKTHTARLLSLATSLRCANSRGRQCDSGDNMLVISGTGFGGLEGRDGLNLLVRKITEHQRKYPHGIVLLDDLNAMHPSLVALLAPLFGRADRFEGQAADLPSLKELTVIVTTDFGKQGRTFGKSVVEVEKMVRMEFNSLYGSFVPAFVRTLAFAAFSKRSAEEMVRTTVITLPCTAYRYGFAGPNAYGGGVVASSIDDVAVSFLVERYREVWEGRENGHALRRAVEDSLLSLLLKYFDEHGHDRRVWARFHLDEKVGEIVLDAGADPHSMNDL